MQEEEREGSRRGEGAGHGVQGGAGRGGHGVD